MARPLVVGLGLATLDTLGVVPTWPAKNTKSRLTAVARQGGGPAATAIAAAARLGAGARFVGKVGDDDAGRAIVTELASYGVDVEHVVVAKGGRSPASFVAVDASDGSRTVFHDAGVAMDLAPDELDWRCLDGAVVLLVDGRRPDAQRAAIAEARKRGAVVLIDAETAGAPVDALIAESDAVVASEACALEVGDGDVVCGIERLRARGASLAVATLGDRGSVGVDERGTVREPAFVVDVADTTGCGDVYHGAFAVALARRAPLGDCMRFASAAAALAARALGGRGSLPTAAEVDALVRAR